jgi:hypothetical protein
VKAYGHHTRFGHFGEEKNTYNVREMEITLRCVARILVIVSAVLTELLSSKSHSFVTLKMFVSLQHKNFFFSSYLLWKMQVTVKLTDTLGYKSLVEGVNVTELCVCLKTMRVGKYLGLRRFEAGGRPNRWSIVKVQAT